jgi:hypothetical protein
MKLKSFIFIIIFSFVTLKYSFAQSFDTTKIKNDSILKKIFSFIPEEWSVSINDSEFTFERKDSVWILNEDRFNSPKTNETKDEKNERIKQEGKKSKSRLVLKYENRWSYEKILVAKNMNPSIYGEISKLPEKYNITNLYDKSLSSRGNAVYTGVTTNERDQIAKFENEKNKLLSKVVKIPVYNTERYSFFIKSMYGYNDNTHQIYPEEASLQLYQILALFSELTEKFN